MATILDIAERLGVSKGTVSKALNGAPDISETLRKTVLETAVEMGYTRQRTPEKRRQESCAFFVENLDYEEPHQFGYEIVTGFRQMAEPAGFDVEIVPVDGKAYSGPSHYDMFMLQHDYIGAFAPRFHPAGSRGCWSSRPAAPPAVLYDNYIMSNPRIAYVGVDNNEGMELAVSHLKCLGHKKIGYLSGALGSHIMQVRHKGFFHAMRQSGLRGRFRLRRCLLLCQPVPGEASAAASH